MGVLFTGHGSINSYINYVDGDLILVIRLLSVITIFVTRNTYKEFDVAQVVVDYSFFGFELVEFKVSVFDFTLIAFLCTYRSIIVLGQMPNLT